MNENLNLIEILKNCPIGTKFYSSYLGKDVFFIGIYDNWIKCEYTSQIDSLNSIIKFRKDGSLYIGGECMLFPSKDQRDWSKWHLPFVDGDIVFYDNCVGIFKDWWDETLFRNYVKVDINGRQPMLCDLTCSFVKGIEARFATEEEKKKLFKAIKDNGYEWDVETKTLKKLIVPKFKSGDIIVKKDDPTKSWYVQGIETYYSDHYCIITKGMFTNLYFKDQDDWELLETTPKFKVGDRIRHKTNRDYIFEISRVYNDSYGLVGSSWMIPMNYQNEYELVSNKFDISTLKPFDKVLVRDDNTLIWVNAFFGFYDTVTNKKYPFIASAVNWAQCIPYEGNEHLLGTYDDCDEYYKNW